MKLNILYKANPTGDRILAYFKNEWEQVSSYEFEMEGLRYIDISAEIGMYPVNHYINRARAFINSINKETIEGILALNGISASLPLTDTINKHYEVLIWDRTIISIQQIVYGKTTANKKYIEENKIPKIAELAKRALCLLGLDFAMIGISLNGQRKIKITEVDTSPSIRDKDWQVLLLKLDEIKRQYQDGWAEPVEIKLGADPEFMIANSKNNKMIPASDFFPRDGLVGCDNIRIPSRQQRPVAELRPKPDTSPLILYENIKLALEQANKMVPYKNIKWLAGSQPFSGYSIGGHIHFSNLKLNNHILRALDNYLGLSIFLIENPTTAVRRRHKYGQLAEFREKDHGGFEYRTPGSWLITPEITLAVLCLAKIVSSNYKKLNRNVFVNLEAHRAFYNGDQQYFRPLFEDIWGDIQALDSYKEYKNELQVIRDMITENKTWNEKQDIRKAWSLNSLFSKNYGLPKKSAKLSVSSSSIHNNQRSNRRFNGSISTSHQNRVVSTNIGGSHIASTTPAFPRYGTIPP